MRNPFAAGGMKSPYSRLAVFIFIALLLAAAIVGYQIYSHLVEGERRQVRDSLNHVADIQNSAVSGWINERLSDAKVFSNGRFLGETMASWLDRGAPNDEIKRQILDQLGAIQKTYNYRDVALLDIHGNTLLSTYEEPMPLAAVGVETMMHALSSNSTQMSPIHFSSSNNGKSQRIVEIFAPLLSVSEGQSYTPAVLMLRADIDMLFAPFTQSPPIMNAATEILLTEIKDGKVVISFSNLRPSYFQNSDLLPISALTLATAAQSSHSTPFLLQGAQGNTLIAVAQKVSGMPWFMVSVVDQNAIRAHIQRLTWMVVGACANSIASSSCRHCRQRRKSSYCSVNTTTSPNMPTT
jgi:hypothetical protein